MKIEDMLPRHLTQQEISEAIEDAKAFLRYAFRLNRPNLNMPLGRAKWHSVITAEIKNKKKEFYIRELEVK